MRVARKGRHGMGANRLEVTDPNYAPAIRIVVQALDALASAFPEVLDWPDGRIGALHDKLLADILAVLTTKTYFPHSINQNIADGQAYMERYSFIGQGRTLR